MLAGNGKPNVLSKTLKVSKLKAAEQQPGAVNALDCETPVVFIH